MCEEEKGKKRATWRRGRVREEKKGRLNRTNNLQYCFDRYVIIIKTNGSKDE